jgi:serine/threonine protein kinase
MNDLTDVTSELIGNKYKIMNCLSNGAFGYVFKGIHIKNKDEIVAIKIEKNTEMKSLKHETRILNYLYMNKIRRIPAIYWYGTYNHLQCIVMTYYECSLADYIIKKSLDIDKINGIMIKMVDIISQIHGKYVLHRDLKPANFMIKSGELFLIDFGLANFYITENQTHIPNEKTETILGTPKYMSIRIFEGNRYSRRDDILSLGYIYVSMWLNHTPWEPIDFSKWGLSDTGNPNIVMDELNIRHPKNSIRCNNRILSTFLNYIPNINDAEFGNMVEFLEYAYKLEYDELPDYVYIQNLFVKS